MKTKTIMSMALFTIALLVGYPTLQADTWLSPPQPFTTGNDSLSSDFSANAAGLGVTIWQDNQIGVQGVKVSYFSNNAWGPTVVLDSGVVAPTTRVAIDNTNTAVAIWYNPNSTQLRTAYFNGATWSTPTPDPLATVPGNFDMPIAIDMDDSGNAIAAWVDTFAGITYASRFSGGTQTWSAPVVVGTGTNNVSVAYSSSGTAVMEWFDGMNVKVSNYIGGVWGAAVTVGASVNARGNVGIDANGNAIASWIEDVQNDVAVSYYNQISWSAQQILSPAPFNREVSLAMAPNGTAVIAWVGETGIGLSSSFNGTSWNTPIQFATGIHDPTNGYFNSHNMNIAVDTGGNALVVWNTQNSEAMSARLPIGGTAWSYASPIASTSLDNLPDFDGLVDLNIALADNGRGFAVWSQTHFAENLLVFGSFTLFFTDPVLGGRTCTNKFATQSDRINFLSWSLSTNPEVAYYYLRRNGVLIAVIPAATGPFTFEDHNRCKRVPDVYELSTVTILGVEISSTTIVL